MVRNVARGWIETATTASKVADIMQRTTPTQRYVAQYKRIYLRNTWAMGMKL